VVCSLKCGREVLVLTAGAIIRDNPNARQSQIRSSCCEPLRCGGNRLIATPIPKQPRPGSF